MAKAALWAATEPRCELEAFNITNGDYFRWKNLWPRIAAVSTCRSATADHQPGAAHGGQGRPVAQHDRETRPEAHPVRGPRGWPFADYVFGCDWDVMTDVTKVRRFGFHDVVDTEEMFVRLLTRFREERRRAVGGVCPTHFPPPFPPPPPPPGRSLQPV